MCCNRNRRKIIRDAIATKHATFERSSQGITHGTIRSENRECASIFVFEIEVLEVCLEVCTKILSSPTDFSHLQYLPYSIYVVDYRLATFFQEKKFIIDIIPEASTTYLQDSYGVV